MFPVAVGQLCSTSSMSHNLAQCETIVNEAVAAGAKALFLPEASDYLSLTSAESLSLCRPVTTSPFVLGLQALARTHSLPISVGIHEPTHPPSSRLTNTLIWIDHRGAIVHRYQKLHVFDIDLRPNGPYLQESATTEPGSKIVPPYSLAIQNKTDSEGSDANLDSTVDVGSLICFDVRFPEPAIALRRLGAQTLLYPSAFTVPTGTLHWEVLLRARAVENQCFVIAAAQCGRHNQKRVSYGDSIVVAPDGSVLGRLDRVKLAEVELEKEEGRQPRCLVVEIDLGLVEKARTGLPLKRRGDIYGWI